MKTETKPAASVVMTDPFGAVLFAHNFTTEIDAQDYFDSSAESLKLSEYITTEYVYTLSLIAYNQHGEFIRRELFRDMPI
jgi:hypothetical protein